MIQPDQLKAVGQIVKQHGIHGEMLILFSLDLNMIPFSFFIVEMDGIFVPFFIQQLTMKKNRSALVQFEEINTVERCRPFIGKTLYLPTDIIPNDEDAQDNSMDDLIGYAMIDQHNQQIGIIRDMDESTQNILFIVQADDKEIYVPANASLIEDIDDDQQIIYVNLPDGLLYINE
jgi:16S rRNA processing protein RimM